MANFVIVGIRRSGIHALQSYIEDQLSNVLVINDVLPELSYRHHESNLPKHDDSIVILEDRPLLDIPAARIFNWYKPDYFILVLRDPLNLMASRYKQMLDGTQKMPRRRRRLRLMFRFSTAVRLYPQYCEEFIGDTSVLGAISVSYNRFIADTKYRTNFGRKIGMPNPESFPQTIHSIADGSSFDQQDYCGRAEEMQVLDRWKHFEDDPQFRRLFTNRMLALGQQIFGVALKQ